MVLALALLLAAPAAAACERVEAVGLHALSWHSKPNLNGATPGLYLRLDCGVQAGTFYNSERRQSFYLAYVLEHDFGPASLGVLAGAATGYDRGAVSPLAGVGAGIDLTDNLGLRLFYGPGGKERDIHTVHAALEWRF